MIFEPAWSSLQLLKSSEGDFQAYEEDAKRRLGEDSVMPKRIKYKQFAR